MAAQQKAASPGRGEAAHNNTINPQFKRTRRALQVVSEAIKARIDKASIAVWRTAYALEEARESHAAHRRLWRQAGCCVALSVFQFFGGRT